MKKDERKQGRRGRPATRQKDQGPKAPDHSSKLSRLVPPGPTRWVIVLLLFAVIGVHLFTGVDTAAFHGDEAWWSSAGYYYSGLMFVDRDYSPASWSKKGYWDWGNLSPPAGKYLIGLAMRASLPDTEYYYPYDFSKSESENRARGSFPPPQVLRPGRMVSAVASLVTCGALFLICLMVWDWAVALLASLFLAFNGLFTLFSHRAMTDAPLTLFMTLGILCCVALVRTAGSKKALFLLLCVGGGVVSGLAVSTKFNGIIALGCIAVTIVYCALFTRPRTLASIVLFVAGGSLATAATAGVAILLNPMYHTASPNDLIARVTMVLNAWDGLILSQQRGNPAQAITGFPVTAIGKLATAYLSPVLSTLALVGLVRWVNVAIGEAFTNKLSTMFVAGSSFLIVLFVVLLWIPLDWDRYYLPMVVVLVPFSAFGAGGIADELYRRLKN